MTVRDTSLAAYIEEEESGRFTERQILILETLKKLGEASDREIGRVIGKEDMNFVTPTRNRLMNAGLIEAVGKKKDEKTGKTVYVWRVVSHESRAIEKQPGNRDGVRGALRALLD